MDTYEMGRRLDRPPLRREAALAVLRQLVLPSGLLDVGMATVAVWAVVATVSFAFTPVGRAIFRVTDWSTAFLINIGVYTCTRAVFEFLGDVRAKYRDAIRAARNRWSAFRPTSVYDLRTKERP